MTIYRTIKYFALLLIVFSLQSCSEVKSDLPRDDYIRNIFLANSSSFEEIKSVILSNKIYRLALKKGELNVLPDGLVDKVNSGRLVKLLQDDVIVDLVSVKFKKGSFDDINEISFYSYKSGYVGGGQSKGVVYLVDPPRETSLINNLDIYISERKEAGELISGKRVYNLLSDNWYIFYEYVD